MSRKSSTYAQEQALLRASSICNFGPASLLCGNIGDWWFPYDFQSLDHLNNSASWNGYDISSWWVIDDPKDNLQEGHRCTTVALSKAESTEKLHGLIVRDVQDSGMSVYVRIGYYCIRGPVTVLQRVELWHGECSVITLVDFRWIFILIMYIQKAVSLNLRGVINKGESRPPGVI